MKFLSTFFSILLTPLVAIVPLQAEMTPITGLADAYIPAGSIPGNTTVAALGDALQIRLAVSGHASVEANSSVRGYAFAITDSAGLPVSDVAVAIRLPEEGPTGFFADGVHTAVAYTDVKGIATFSQVNWGPRQGKVAIRVTAAKGDLHAGALIEQEIVDATSVRLQIQTPTVMISPPAAVPSAANLPLVVKTAATPAPGTLASIDSVHSGATAEQPTTRIVQTSASAPPVVSIVNTSGNKGSRGSNKKWILLAVVAIGAGVGAAVAMSGKGGSTGAAAASTGISIGSPSVSVGH